MKKLLAVLALLAIASPAPATIVYRDTCSCAPKAKTVSTVHLASKSGPARTLRQASWMRRPAGQPGSALRPYSAVGPETTIRNEPKGVMNHGGSAELQALAGAGRPLNNTLAGAEPKGPAKAESAPAPAFHSPDVMPASSYHNHGGRPWIPFLAGAAVVGLVCATHGHSDHHRVVVIGSPPGGGGDDDDGKGCRR